MEGLERAEVDLARGDVRKARDRLKGLVNTYPDDLEIRRLLAEAYRRYRQFAEAGRWGYLFGPHASDRERRAFERHNGFGWSSRITESRLRHLLRCDDLSAIADEKGRALLRDLPRTRSLRRRDGPIAAVLCRLAIARARVAHR